MVKIKRIKLGSQGLDVSTQGLRCIVVLAFYGPSKPEPDIITLIHHAIDSDITFLDTFDIYGPFTNELLKKVGYYTYGDMLFFLPISLLPNTCTYLGFQTRSGSSYSGFYSKI